MRPDFPRVQRNVVRQTSIDPDKRPLDLTSRTSDNRPRGQTACLSLANMRHTGDTDTERNEIFLRYTTTTNFLRTHAQHYRSEKTKVFHPSNQTC